MKIKLSAVSSIIVFSALVGCATPAPEPLPDTQVASSDAKPKRKCVLQAQTGSLVQKEKICESDSDDRTAISNTMQSLTGAGFDPHALGN